MSSTTEIIKSYCRSCCNDNNHKVLFRETINSDSDDYHCATDYSTIRCLGCGTILFKEDFHDYEEIYPNYHDEWEHSITTTIYPSFLRSYRQLEDSWKLPNSIKTVFEESINALKANCNLLAGAGFRAVIEAVCLDKDIKGRNLELKINNLSKEGLITKKECERLHSVRFLGNDSIHEMKVPDRNQLEVVLSVIEHILTNIYLIDLKIGKTLETPITQFPEFKILIKKKLEACKILDEFPLVKFLGKDVRRVKDNFVNFESELVNEISNGTFVNLALGAVKPFGGSTGNVQHYIVSEIIPLTPMRNRG